MAEFNDYRATARHFEALATTAHSPWFAEACRELADSYAALARFHERSAWIERCTMECVAAPRSETRLRG